MVDGLACGMLDHCQVCCFGSFTFFPLVVFKQLHALESSSTSYQLVGELGLVVIVVVNLLVGISGLVFGTLALVSSDGGLLLTEAEHGDWKLCLRCVQVLIRTDNVLCGLWISEFGWKGLTEKEGPFQDYMQLPICSEPLLVHPRTRMTLEQQPHYVRTDSFCSAHMVLVPE